MLTDRQKLTLQHLEENGVISLTDKVAWAESKMKISRKKLNGKTRRYYREILEFLKSQ